MDPQQQWHTQRMVIGGPAGGSGLSGNAPTEVLKETLARLEECHKAVMIIVGKLGMMNPTPPAPLSAAPTQDGILSTAVSGRASAVQLLERLVQIAEAL